MPRIQIARLEADTARKIPMKDTSVKVTRFRDPAGDVRTMRTVDANSDTLDLDLTYVFGKNVEAARSMPTKHVSTTILVRCLSA